MLDALGQLSRSLNTFRLILKPPSLLYTRLYLAACALIDEALNLVAIYRHPSMRLPEVRGYELYESLLVMQYIEQNEAVETELASANGTHRPKSL